MPSLESERETKRKYLAQELKGHKIIVESIFGVQLDHRHYVALKAVHIHCSFQRVNMI